jgi:protein TonB
MLKIAVAGGVVIASVFGLSELHVFNGAVTSPAAPVEVSPSATAAATPSAEAPTAQPEQETTPDAPKPQPVKPAAIKTAVKPDKPAQQADKPQSTASAPQTLVAQNTTPDPSPLQQRPLAPAAPPVALTPRPTTPAPPAPAVAAPVAPALTPKPAETIAPITPPHAVRQVAPVLSDKVRRSIVGEAIVRVKVNVDSTGRVTSAEPVAGAVSDAIANTAVEAVRHWQFEPARQGGEKVSGDVVLSFIFRK